MTELVVVVNVVPENWTEVTVVRSNVVVSRNSVSVTREESVTVAVPESTVVVVLVTYVINVVSAVETAVLMSVCTVDVTVVETFSRITVLVELLLVVTTNTVIEGVNVTDVATNVVTMEHMTALFSMHGTVTNPTGELSLRATHEPEASDVLLTQMPVWPPS